MSCDLNVKNLCENNESCIKDEKENNKEEKEEEEEEELKIFTYHFKNCLSDVTDSVISCLIIGPLVIGHWRGVWNLMDLYEMPFSGLVCFIIGTGLHLIFVLSRELLHYYFAVIWRNSNPIGRAGYHFVRLWYTYIFSVTCNMQWRGGWIVLSSMMGENEWTVSVVTISLLSVLLILRCSRNLLAPPLIVVADIPTSIFTFPTRYRKKKNWEMNIDQDWRMVELRTTGVTSSVTRDRPATRYNVHYTVLTILDAIFSAFVAAPAVVGYWRGTWSLSDFYIYPEDPFWSNATSIIVGYGGLFFFNVIQHFLNDFLHPDKHRLLYYFGSRIYTAIFGFCCVNAWRGGWHVLHLYTEQNPNTNTRDWTLYVLDCLFSVGIVGTLVVFVWRGIWVLLDLHLFPDNREYSSICSLIIGYVIVAITFCLQPVMRYACSRIQGLPRLLAADAFLLLSFIGTVNVWRGVWSMLDLWFIPEDPELSCWITHVGCFVFLGLLNCSNSILVRGVYIDAEEEEGRCVIFPCHYLRLFFKIEREKKEARRRNLMSIPRDYTENNGKDLESGALLNCTTLPTVIPSSQDHQG
ncbi:Protein of unknown function [Cotesia congregata]|uniref:Uncharacterized protein n=1 Tax=Cotesia congregata TaxID=51543 RepID=A0A8J2H8B3_COTCN|nr:Protein of unknown function [Cotesia congregata]